VKGTRVRLVHIPEDIDIIANIEKQLALIQSRRKPISLKKNIDPKT
jgi:hypothetical protein